MGSIGPGMDGSHEFTPYLYPPFPSGTQPCVDLSTFSLSKLLSTDPSEQRRLYEICKTQGFFLLDMTETYAESIPSEAEAIVNLSEEFFKLPLEKKMEYSYLGNNKSILGYKQSGAGPVDSKGTKDTAEFFNCSKDIILGNFGYEQTLLPHVLSRPSSRTLIGEYQKKCHKVGLDLLRILASQLGASPDTISHLHRITELSGDQVRMIRAPPRNSPDLSNAEISVPGHTDFGSITILFNWMGGLQLWSEPSRNNFHNIDDPTSDTTNSTQGQWLWVKPKRGHAIVNLGDAAVKLFGGVLCSGRHRVVPAPGKQGLWPRYSLVYFVRPEDKIILKRLEGGNIPPAQDGEEDESITAAKWVIQQALKLRAQK